MLELAVSDGHCIHKVTEKVFVAAQLLLMFCSVVKNADQSPESSFTFPRLHIQGETVTRIGIENCLNNQPDHQATWHNIWRNIKRNLAKSNSANIGKSDMKTWLKRGDNRRSPTPGTGEWSMRTVRGRPWARSMCFSRDTTFTEPSTVGSTVLLLR